MGRCLDPLTELTRPSSPGGRWIMGWGGFSIGFYSRRNSLSLPNRISPVPGMAQRPSLCLSQGQLLEGVMKPHSGFGLSSQFLPCLPVLWR